MQGERGIGYRRHQRQRAKARAIRYLSRLRATRPELISERVVGRFAVDRVPCSCFLCGNPRKFTGEVTRQELLAQPSHDFACVSRRMVLR